MLHVYVKDTNLYLQNKIEFLLVIYFCFKAIDVRKLKISNNFTVTIYTNGSYNLEINNNIWLNSADIFLQANGKFHEIKDKSLVLNSNIKNIVLINKLNIINSKLFKQQLVVLVKTH